MTVDNSHTTRSPHPLPDISSWGMGTTNGHISRRFGRFCSHMAHSLKGFGLLLLAIDAGDCAERDRDGRVVGSSENRAWFAEMPQGTRRSPVACPV